MVRESAIYIGVDPAFRAGGFCVCIADTGNKLVDFMKMDYDQFRDWINDGNLREIAAIAIENSNLQKTLFWTHKSPAGKLLSAKQAKYTVGAKPLSKQELINAAMTAGKNQAISELTYRAAVLRFGATRVYQVSPLEKGPKITDQRYFAGYLKALGFTSEKDFFSQDEMDAFVMCDFAMHRAKAAAKLIR